MVLLAKTSRPGRLRHDYADGCDWCCPIPYCPPRAFPKLPYLTFGKTVKIVTPVEKDAFVGIKPVICMRLVYVADGKLAAA
jgi:hypothetical protein